jgi:hypothetical protein
MKYEECEEEKSGIYREIVHEKIGDIVTVSDLKPVSNEEIEEAKKQYKKTKKCDHTIIFDVYGFMYDNRYCYICGESQGLV